jgi:hypothetical protein
LDDEDIPDDDAGCGVGGYWNVVVVLDLCGGGVTKGLQETR